MTQKPLVPEDVSPRYADAVWRRSFMRAAVAHTLARAGDTDPDRIVARQWPNDTAAGMLVRGAVDVTTTGSASALTVTTVPNFLSSLAPASAGAALLEQTLRLAFDGAGIISVPGFVAAAANVGFVSEAAPIPVKALTVTPLLIEPYKLAVIVAVSREMAESSNAERMIADALSRSVGLSLDAALFGTDAAVADTRPAGLRNGISALTASASADPATAMMGDVRTVLSAVSAVAGNTLPILVAAPARAASLRLLGGYGIGAMTILASSAIAAGDLIAIAPNAIVSATDSVPQISVSTESVIHSSDTPANIGVAGSPATVAAPSYSMFQTDLLAIKCRMMATWARRNDAAVAWVTATAW